MVWASDWGVLNAVGAVELLPRLDRHLNIRDEHVVLRHEHTRILDHEPLASPPLSVMSLLLGEIEAAPHANHRLVVFTHRELFQQVVCLKEHLASARSGQPRRLKPLPLHRVLGIISGARRIERESRLSALGDAATQREGEELQIHSSSWLTSLRDTHGGFGVLLLVQHKAAHALRRTPVAQRACVLSILGDPVRSPPNVILVSGSCLPCCLSVLALLLLLLHLPHHEPRDALAMHLALSMCLDIDEVAQRQAAMATQGHNLFVRVLNSVEVVNHCLPQGLASRFRSGR
mmetsp:Transcript_79045/g.183388  ORF Transcript_79045/g.183388 Transcript_79045/m.183388 type:complete len:289 (+) Transcript_79045:1831-2697(+)